MYMYMHRSNYGNISYMYNQMKQTDPAWNDSQGSSSLAYTCKIMLSWASLAPAVVSRWIHLLHWIRKGNSPRGYNSMEIRSQHLNPSLQQLKYMHRTFRVDSSKTG